MNRAIVGLTAIIAGVAASPAVAQEKDETLGKAIESAEVADALPAEEDSVFDDTWLGIGVAVKVDPTYDGSDNYRFGVIPAAAGSIAGISFSPRSAGVAIGLVEVDLGRDLEFNAGPVGRVRRNRASGIKDPVVAAAGELGTAIELGGTFGLTFKRLLNGYDRLSFGTDLRWDVNGAHGGFVATPGVSYRTPLSRGTVISAGIGATYGSGEFNDYYYSVDPVQSTASGLPVFSAGSGFYRAGAGLAFGVDLDGNFENGGFVIGTILGYSRMLGDAKRSPYTSIRGSAEQFHAATGVGYIF